jgi:hypothetical protein
MKTKLTTTLLALASLIAVNTASAGTGVAEPAVVIAVPADTITFSGQTIVRHQYLGTDVGVPFYNKPVLQGNATITHSSGIFLDIWHSSALNAEEWNKNFAYEVDYTAGFSTKLGPLETTFAVSLFDCFGVGDGLVDDIVLFGVDVVLPTKEINDRLSVTPSFGYGYYWIPSSETEFEGGNVANICLNYEFELAPKWTLKFSPGVLWHDGPFGLEAGTILKLGAGLDYHFSDAITLNLLEVTGYVPLIGGDEADVAIGIGMSWKFGKR